MVVCELRTSRRWAGRTAGIQLNERSTVSDWCRVCELIPPYRKGRRRKWECCTIIWTGTIKTTRLWAFLFLLRLHEHSHGCIHIRNYSQNDNLRNSLNTTEMPAIVGIPTFVPACIYAHIPCVTCSGCSCTDAGVIGSPAPPQGVGGRS